MRPATQPSARRLACLLAVATLMPLASACAQGVRQGGQQAAREAGSPESAPQLVSSSELAASRSAAAAPDLASAPVYRDRADSIASVKVRSAAGRADGLRVIVELHRRTLWVVNDQQDTLLTAPVAIGTGTTLEHNGRRWTFDTPRSVRRVRVKKADPVWTPPDWHYVEIAKKHGLALRKLPMRGAVKLKDGGRLMVRQGEVGIVHAGDTAFVPLVLDEHIVFDGTLFVPPIGTKNRQIPRELGPYALDMGDGYLLHGTPYQDSIGRATSHGCVRMRDEDITWLYQNVPVGTKVYIY